MGSALELVCVGHIVSEMIHFPDKIQGPVLGGPPAYCSVAAARQGTATGLVTRIGPDMPPQLLKPFAEAGVDTLGVDASGRTTQSVLVYDGCGNKEIRYPAKAEPLRASDLPESYRGCRLMYVCTMDCDVLPTDIPDLVAQAEISAVDLGGYGGVHMSKAHRENLGSPARLARDVASSFDIVKASDEDAIAIFGQDAPDLSARELLRCGAEVVVITVGSKGALIYTAEGKRTVPALPCTAIDTTGGGDSFMAGFFSEYLRTADPIRSAQWGSATASWVIEQSGGVRPERMPTFQQVRERAEAYYPSAI
jgi:sugar/nucleoside kinase (ribokinase family)